MKTKNLILLFFYLFAVMASFAQYHSTVKINNVQNVSNDILPNIAITKSGAIYYSIIKGNVISILNIDSTLQIENIVKKITVEQPPLKGAGTIKRFYPTLHCRNSDGNFLLFYRGFVYILDGKFDVKSKKVMPGFKSSLDNINFVQISEYNIRRIWDYDSILHYDVDSVLDGNRTALVTDKDFNYINDYGVSRISSPFSVDGKIHVNGFTYGGLFGEERAMQSFVYDNDTLFMFSQYKYFMSDVKANKNWLINPFRTSNYPASKYVVAAHTQFNKDKSIFFVGTRYANNTHNITFVNRGWFTSKKCIRTFEYNDTLLGVSDNNGMIFYNVYSTPDNTFIVSYMSKTKKDGYLWTIRKYSPEYFFDTISKIKPSKPVFYNKSIFYVSNETRLNKADTVKEVPLYIRSKYYNLRPRFYNEEDGYNYDYVKTDYKVGIDTITYDNTDYYTGFVGLPQVKDSTINDTVNVESNIYRDTTIKVVSLLQYDSLKIKDTVIDTLIIVKDTVYKNLGYIYLYDSADMVVKMSYENGFKVKIEGYIGYITIIIQDRQFTVKDGDIIEDDFEMSNDGLLEIKFKDEVKYAKQILQ